MSAFVVCSATAAAGLAVAFEIGRVAEKRWSGSSKMAMPFENFDVKSEEAKLAAQAFVGLFFVEILLVPTALNPFSYLTSNSTSFQSLLALFVFGSWSGLLVMGAGGIASSVAALNLEREALVRERVAMEHQIALSEEKLEEEREIVAKQKRINFASAAAVAGEWKKLHIAREEDLHRGIERAENEKIWSPKMTKQFDKKVMHVVDNATDRRWREIEDQDLTLEAMRLRNKEKSRIMKEQRALREERATSEKESLKEETSKLLKITDELEDLTANIDKLKEENKKKEEERIKEIKEREAALSQKEKTLDEYHSKKLEELKKQELTLKSKEEEFESGEEHKRLKELMEKMESSKLTVARFNEEVMKKERQKLEEFRKREEELKKQEEELKKRVDVASKFNYNYNRQEGPDDEKSVSMRLLTVVRDMESVSENMSKDLAKIKEDNIILFDEPKTSESATDAKPQDEATVQPTADEKTADESEKPSEASLMDATEEEVAEKTEPVPEQEESPVVKKSIADKSVLDAEEEDGSITSVPKAEEDRNDVSDSDSLSHQIQRDIAALDRKESSEDITIGEPEVQQKKGPFSPLQERIKNNYFRGYFGAEKKVDETKIPVLPVSPTYNTMASEMTFKTKHDAATIISAISALSDPTMVEQQENKVSRKKKSRSKKKKNSNKSYVVSEDAAVEVIAWSDPGPY